jgi:limonene 1,2-monooxygenase
MMAHDWVRPDAARRHYELFAQHVMPAFQGSARGTQAAEAYAQSRWQDLNDRQAAALAAATQKHAELRASQTTGAAAG